MTYLRSDIMYYVLPEFLLFDPLLINERHIFLSVVQFFIHVRVEATIKPVSEEPRGTD